jgi:hypothetical protein
MVNRYANKAEANSFQRAEKLVKEGAQAITVRRLSGVGSLSRWRLPTRPAPELMLLWSWPTGPLPLPAFFRHWVTSKILRYPPLRSVTFDCLGEHRQVPREVALTCRGRRGLGKAERLTPATAILLRRADLTAEAWRISPSY